MRLDVAFRRLEHEYLNADRLLNPPKVSIPIARSSDGLITSYFNMMSAVLTTGEFGGKLVFVNEGANILTGRVVVFDKDGNLIVNCRADRLTAIRCGLMAALAIKLFFGSVENSRLRIGFVGMGRINSATLEVLHLLWGCDEFLIKGSPHRPYPKPNVFLDGISYGHVVDAGDLAACDVVISCTNLQNPSEALSADNFSGGNVRLFIAQDGGWTLGPSFRRLYPSFCDSTPQILKNLSHEFPFDTPIPFAGSASDLREMRHPTFRNEFDPACVYLTGMALADLSVAIGLQEATAGAPRLIQS